MTALYSAASQMKELDKAEEHLQAMQKILPKPKINDFIETSMISRAAKSKILEGVGKDAGTYPKPH